MADFNAVRVALAGKLAAEGLTVTLDPRNVNTPTVVVGLPDIPEPMTGCAWRVTVPVYAVAPAPGNLDAVEWMLDTVAVILELDGAAAARPTVYDPAPGSLTPPLPAYVCTITTTAT